MTEQYKGQNNQNRIPLGSEDYPEQELWADFPGQYSGYTEEELDWIRYSQKLKQAREGNNPLPPAGNK